MPRESQRKRQFVKALYNPQADFVISKSVLIKHLDLILRVPWVNVTRSSNDEPKKFTDGLLNKKSLGLYYGSGEIVRLKINKMVINWTINSLIILTNQPNNLQGEVINCMLAKLIVLLKDLYGSLESEKDNIETQDIWLDIENSFKKTFSDIDKKLFLGAVIDASIVDLVSLRLNAFKKITADFKGFLTEDIYNFRHRNIDFQKQFNKNEDFLDAMLIGTTRFFNLILKDHEMVASYFQDLPGQLRNKQLQTIRLRTVPRAHHLGDVMNLLFALFLAAIFFRFIGGKTAYVLTTVCWTVLFVGYLTHMQNNRNAKPEYLIRSETDYFKQHDAALDRIYNCVNMQPVKIRYLETNKKVMFFQSIPPQKSDSLNNQSRSLEEAKLKSKAVKKQDKVKSKSKSEIIKESMHHRRLPSIDWKDQHFLRFSENNGADPAKPFPVNINGIPRGRVFCMFSPNVIRNLQDRGINNLLEVASHSASSKGEQGIVKTKNFYATEDGIFEAVAKVKFLGSKGGIRIFMREATQGPDGEKLWLGDGFQSDHQFSNS